MTIQIYNTLTCSKEEFKPLRDNVVTMYVCGVTPYDEVHLGHARVYVTFDIVRRHLEQSGYQVIYIQNFTDIDDKIIRRARERGIAPLALAQENIDDYFTQMDKLGIQRAHAYPRVTETISPIVSFIETLVKKHKAYATPSGDVYFSVHRFRNYGALSKRNTDELISGARVEIGEEKKDPLDFALWKAAKPDEPPEASWDSPWGRGRPGWHIECSVMATTALGPTIDIHGGGQDLIFPHHENEIAQSEAGTGQPFVHYWMHNGFVTINHEKMSKSLGNFFTLREIFEHYSPRVVRYFLLSQHYRSPLDFSDDKLRQAQNALEGIDEARVKLAQLLEPAGTKRRTAADEVLLEDVVAEFRENLDDDFNTEKALAVIHTLKRSALAGKDPAYLQKASATLRTLLEDFLGIAPAQAQGASPEALRLKTDREAARRARDWKKSDELRGQLEGLGFRVQDNPDGTSLLIPTTLE